MTAENFNKHFCDRMGEVDRGQLALFSKLWNLLSYDKTNGEITRIPRSLAAYQKVKKKTEGWGDYKRVAK